MVPIVEEVVRSKAKKLSEQLFVELRSFFLASLENVATYSKLACFCHISTWTADWNLPAPRMDRDA